MDEVIANKLKAVVTSCVTHGHFKTAKRYVCQAKLSDHITWSDWRYFMGMIAGRQDIIGGQDEQL